MADHRGTGTVMSANSSLFLRNGTLFLDVQMGSVIDDSFIGVENRSVDSRSTVGQNLTNVLLFFNIFVIFWIFQPLAASFDHGPILSTAL